MWSGSAAVWGEGAPTSDPSTGAAERLVTLCSALTLPIPFSRLCCRRLVLHIALHGASGLPQPHQRAGGGRIHRRHDSERRR